MDFETTTEVRITQQTPRSRELPFFESGKFYDTQYVIEHTKIPEDPAEIPHILCFYGPARGGTTAFGLLMASNPEVKRSYFQPHKNQIRHGKDLVISPAQPEDLIVMKDTFGPIHDEELFDPVDLLMKAGVPPEKLTVVMSLRDPVAAVRSLDKLLADGVNVDFYARMQQHTIDLFKRYRQLLGERAIPFSFDLMEGRSEEEVIRRLMEKTGLGLKEDLNMEFDPQALAREGGKMVWGEAEDSTYYREVVEPTVKQGRYRYVSSTLKGQPLPVETEAAVRKACMGPYLEYQEMARQELGL